MITYSIEEFEKKSVGDISSAWFFGFRDKETNLSKPNYIIGFVNSNPPSIEICGERKTILEKEKRPTYYKMYIKDSSDIGDFSKKLQERFGGKIEPSQCSATLSFDEYSIENPEMQISSKEIAEVLRFILAKLPIKKFSINTHSTNPK